MRRKRKYKKEIKPDPKYNNNLVAKLINYIMEEGKKSIAQKIVYDAFEKMAEVTKKDALEVFDLAIRNASPTLEVKSRRVGGARYQIPREVRGERRIALAMRWIIQAAKAKKGKPMFQKLAEELISASKNEGTAVRKREDTHRMAEANRAFAHFAW